MDADIEYTLNLVRGFLRAQSPERLAEIAEHTKAIRQASEQLAEARQALAMNLASNEDIMSGAPLTVEEAVSLLPYEERIFYDGLDSDMLSRLLVLRRMDNGSVQLLNVAALPPTVLRTWIVPTQQMIMSAANDMATAVTSVVSMSVSKGVTVTGVPALPANSVIAAIVLANELYRAKK